MGDFNEPPRKAQPLRYLLKNESKMEALSTKAHSNPGCQRHKCAGALMRPPPERPIGVVRPVHEVRQQAEDFQKEYYESMNKIGSAEHKKRLEQIHESLDKTGTYDLTDEELSYGAKTAWRNAPRCIGRIQWKNLKLFDGRDCKTTKDMYQYLLKHMDYANNGGNLRSCITVFPKRTDYKHDFRVWNSQLVSFAGYKNSDGTILGDPAYVEFTEMCMKLGWKGDRTSFDVLPWVLQADGGPPEVYDIPKDMALLVNLKHPTYKWFEEMALKWYAVPAVANMMFDCGGIEFPGSPFNGWYMGTEVGSRDLCDSNRLNLCEVFGRKMGLDVRQNINLWKDKVLVEVNLAVLHSYRAAGITMVDHHTASEQFMSHLETEYRVRGGCPADWVWIVPPMSSSITPVFHMEMLHYKLKPSYEYQNDIWRSYKFGDEPERENRLTLKIISKALVFATSLMRKTLLKRKRCTILYATETGKSREFAKEMCKIASFAFNPRLLCMDEYNFKDLEKENLVLVIASTFGNGDPPDNGMAFFDTLKGRGQNGNNLKNKIGHIKFAVFALGSTAYPCFCYFGKNIDTQLDHLGAQRVHALGEGDELQGQDESFKTWAADTFRAACASYSIDIVNILKSGVAALLGDDMRWAANNYKFTKQESFQATELDSGLEHVHKKKISLCTVKAKVQLQTANSSRKTLFVNLDTDHNENLHFEPGDHVAIFPSNKASLVNAVLKHMKPKPGPDDNVKIQRQPKAASDSGDWQNYDSKLPAVMSLRSALTHYIDITSPPSQKLLAQFALLATSKEERSRLERLSKEPKTYTQWRNDKVPNLLDVFRDFPSVKPESSFILTQLPVLQPRYYSISSSPSLHAGDIHITVAIVAYQTIGSKGSTKYGVCSNWLNELNTGDKVRCFIRSAAKFHLPGDLARPVIMVGPGTGIAPLRSFWQARYVDKIQKKKTTGPMTLYFGCRYFRQDNIYEGEKNEMVKCGVMKQNTAFSRETDHTPKVYVQDLLLRDGSQLYTQLVTEKGHIYVCGDVGMAADVRTTVEKILQKHGGMSAPAAKEALDNLRSSNCYHEDIFGTLKAPDATTERSQDTKNRIVTPPVQQSTNHAKPLVTRPSKVASGTPMIKSTTQGQARAPMSNGTYDPESDDEKDQGCSSFLKKRQRKKTRPVEGVNIRMSTNL